MPPEAAHFTCPDCDEPLAFAFHDTSGVGAWKRGDGFNTTPDTAHYICFPCAKAWKQRLSGPLTPDVLGDLAFFTCQNTDCGAKLSITHASATPTETELACAQGHRYRIEATDEGLGLRAESEESEESDSILLSPSRRCAAKRGRSDSGSRRTP